MALSFGKMTASDATAAFYNRLAPWYSLIDLFLRPQKEALAHLLNQLPEGSLIDLGVGDGSSFPIYGKHKLTGIDVSEKMLAKAQRKAPENIQLLLGNIHELPFPEATFDYALLSHVLSTVAHPEQVLAEAARVLKPGGKCFLLNHFTPRNGLGLLDRLFSPFSRFFRFSSVFYEHTLPIPTEFRKIGSRYWLGGYFGLIVYERI